jgi:hypothetical protein
MSELGQGRVVVKESRGHFIPDLPDFGKKSSRGESGAKSGHCDWGIKKIFKDFADGNKCKYVLPNLWPLITLGDHE